MQHKLKRSNTNINRKNISYYDQIADNYDSLMAGDPYNEQVRNEVSQVFCKAVPAGLIIDFGGGTGLDLEWLNSRSYHIIFCEPSVGMRQKAVELAKAKRYASEINFLEGENTDFHTWEESLAFTVKADAVLLNFAVINCIPDIGFLFKNMALVTRKGAQIYALVLVNSFLKRCQTSFSGMILAILTGSVITRVVNNSGNSQTVFLHSLRSIRTASSKYFYQGSHKPIPGSGFHLIHLIRK